MLKRFQQILFARPGRTIALFVLVVVIVVVQRGFALHSARSDLLRHTGETKMVHTYAQMPDWCVHNGLGPLLPASMFDVVYAVQVSSDEEFQSVGRNFDLSEVTYISLSGPGVTDASVPLINTCPLLETLILSDTSMTAAGTSRISVKRNLVTFHCYRTGLDDSFFANPRQLNRLEDVSLFSSSLSDKGVEKLSMLPSLKSLILFDAPAITNACTPSLGQMTLLTDLTLGELQINEAGFQHFELPPNLSVLDLSNLGTRTLPREFKDRLFSQSTLTELAFWQMELSEEDVLELLELPEMCSLLIPRSRVTRKVLTRLAEFPSIEICIGADQVAVELTDHLNELMANDNFALAVYFEEKMGADVDWTAFKELRRYLYCIYFQDVTLTDNHRDLLSHISTRNILCTNVVPGKQGLDFLEHFDTLTTLQLHSTPVSTPDIARIMALDDIDYLSIEEAGFNDEAATELLKRRFLPSAVSLRGHSLSAAMRRRLMDEVPDTLFTF